jgi:hypothetical protein
VLPLDEDDKKIYKMMEPETIASVVYSAKWLIYSHVFEAGLFLYVVYEAQHHGMYSLDVVIVRAGNTEQHTLARYVTNYIPCMNSSGTAIKRQTVGCRIHTSGHCMHAVHIGREYLANIVRDVYQYLHTVGFCFHPNTDYDYHMRELASRHLVVVSKYLIKQFINSIRLLYENTRILDLCKCCNRFECVCKSVVEAFC